MIRIWEMESWYHVKCHQQLPRTAGDLPSHFDASRHARLPSSALRPAGQQWRQSSRAVAGVPALSSRSPTPSLCGAEWRGQVAPDVHWLAIWERKSELRRPGCFTLDTLAVRSGAGDLSKAVPWEHFRKPGLGQMVARGPQEDGPDIPVAPNHFWQMALILQCALTGFPVAPNHFWQLVLILSILSDVY